MDHRRVFIYVNVFGPIMVFMAHGLMNFMPTFKNNIIKKLRNNYVNFLPIMVFLDYGLTNFIPIFKKNYYMILRKKYVLKSHKLWLLWPMV
jgi:hypothetical protein